jgi:hypothetical protein
MLHKSTFEYLKPTDEQMQIMAAIRVHFADFASIFERAIPDSPDKTYLMRKLREVAMWANVAITRDADGSLRQ